MANPFKQAEQAKKKAPGNKKAEEKKEIVVTEETPKVEETVEVNPVEVKETKKAEPKKTEKKEKEVKETKDIFAGLKTEKAAGKTYAFYLKDENVDKLKKKAEKMGITTSKLLDHILGEVL